MSNILGMLRVFASVGKGALFFARTSTTGLILNQKGGESALALTKERKQELVAQYTALLTESQAVVITTYTGLTVAEMEELRRGIRQAGGKFMVAKNTLLKRAFREAGYPIPEEALHGSTAVAFATEDPPAVAKVLVDFAKDHEVVQIKAGFLEREPMTAEQVKQLASLPPLPVMRAQLLGTLMAPASQLARLLAEPARQVAAVLKARSEQEASAAA